MKIKIFKRKGEKRMISIKIGKFPGKLDNYTLEDGTTVAEALEMAGLSVGDEQEIKLDGEVVNMNDIIEDDANMLLVTKRLKGAKVL